MSSRPSPWHQEPGHVARDCLAPAPKTRTMRPQGNKSGSGVARGPPLQLPAPLQEQCTVVGRVGHIKGLYLKP
uniref:Uncharacterized protein n=1 Tax=Haplochromis burtoni TaxID=8153 RepID=A0A3Q2X2X4_HAPBU